MKLAEALQERADLRIRIQHIHERLTANALIQEGEKPAEEPTELLKELDSCLRREEKLITMINLRNCITRVDNHSLTELIAMREALLQEISIKRDVLLTASQTANRATGREIRILSSVNVREWQKNVDALSARLREINKQIQATNWTTDL